MTRKFTSVLSSLLLAGCSVVGIRSGTETPPYQVVATLDEIEIRQYGPRIAAETSIEADEDTARSDGFRRLAGYIFGANSSNTRIDMTAPVAQSAETIAMTAPVAQQRDEAGHWVVRFTMPAAASLDSLPKPSNPLVRLVVVPSETIAALRFTGFASVSVMDAKRKALVAAVQATNWHAIGAPMAWYYDPPWTIPFLRRNEVAVAVKPAS